MQPQLRNAHKCAMWLAGGGRRHNEINVTGQFQLGKKSICVSCGNVCTVAASPAFVAAYEKLGGRRDPSSFGAWVLKIPRRPALRMGQRRVSVSPTEASGDRAAFEGAAQ